MARKRIITKKTRRDVEEAIAGKNKNQGSFVICLHDKYVRTNFAATVMKYLGTLGETDHATIHDETRKRIYTVRKIA